MSVTSQTPRAADRLARAHEALAEGEPESALQILQAEPRPAGPEADLARARCHTLIAEDFDAALSALIRAGEAGADPEAVHAAYAPLVTAPLSRRLHARLLDWLAERLEDPDLWVALSRLQLRRGLAEKAEDSARRAIALDPAHEAAWRTLFVVVMGSDQPERGADIVREALRSCPTNPRFPAVKALFAGLDRAETDILVAEISSTWPGSNIAALTGRPQAGKPPPPEAMGAYRAALEGDRAEARARAAQHLATRTGEIATAQDETILDVLDAVPGPGSRTRPLIVDDGAEVLRSEPSESGVTLLFFTNLAHQSTYQAEVIDAFAAAQGAATMILRDYSYRLFIGGVGSLADTRAGTLDALVDALHALNTRQLLVAGVSSGGFSAPSYGRELGCERVLGLSISSTIGRFLRGDDRRARMLIAKLARSFPPEELDLTLKLPTIGNHAPLELYYGDRNVVDQAHSEDLAGFPGVTLRPVAGLARHQVLPSLILDGAFQRWLADPARDDM